MSVERQVSTHYTAGNLGQKILGALRNAGKDPAHLSSDDIAPLDNFHLGGRQAISDLASFMHLSPGMHLLDVGCGVGGPARYFAGARMSGDGTGSDGRIRAGGGEPDANVEARRESTIPPRKRA